MTTTKFRKKYKVIDPQYVYNPVFVRVTDKEDDNEQYIKDTGIAKMYGCPTSAVAPEHVAEMMATVKVEEVAWETSERNKSMTIFNYKPGY